MASREPHTVSKRGARRGWLRRPRRCPEAAAVAKDTAEILLPNAVSARFGQDGVLWTIIGSFWSTNAVLLVALGATGDWATSESLVKVICGTGLFVSFLWFVMQAAALRRVLYYESLTTALESAIGVPERTRMFGRDPEASVRGAPFLPEARKVMPFGPLVAIVGWAVGTYFAFA